MLLLCLDFCFAWVLFWEVGEGVLFFFKPSLVIKILFLRFHLFCFSVVYFGVFFQKLLRVTS